MQEISTKLKNFQKLEEIVLSSLENLRENESDRKLNYIEKDFKTRFFNSVDYISNFFRFDNHNLIQKFLLKMARDEILKMQKYTKKLNDNGRMKIANDVGKLYNSLREEYVK